MPRITISDLSSKEYEHPLDRIALENLKKIPALPKLMEIINIPYNSISRAMHSGSYLRINDKQMPSMYKLMREACEILGVDEPEFYMSSDTVLNAYTSCPDKPIVCVSGYLVDFMDDDELMFVIGHELSHIKSQHIIYSALANVLREGILETILSAIPGIGLVSGGISVALNYAFYEWYQAGELTCDRGGYLACQNFNASAKALMKLAGFSRRYANELNYDEFLNQARNFENKGSDVLGAVQKIILGYMASTHPYNVSRVFELLKFEENGIYSNIIQRKPLDPEQLTSVNLDVSSVKQSAQDTLEKTKNLAGNMFSKLKK